VIMALLGGAGALFGPLLGAVPLVLLFDVLSANFPTHFSILLGAVFVLIVYALPRGVIGLVPARPQPVVIASAPPQANEKAHGAPLEVSVLRKSFGGLVAVDDLSFSVGRGEIVGLIGPNGSGKTTVLNLISGALVPDAGSIRFKDRELVRLGAHRIARLGIARTFQLVRPLESMSLIDNVAPALAFRREPVSAAQLQQAAAGLLARVGLADRTALAAAQLTYIDQKRLELARALALDPDLLLLDEWLAGLNPTELSDGIALIRSLRESGITIILVEHVMDAIRSLCDRCIVMNAGRKIAEGPAASVLAEPDVVRAYLGDADA
jgi:branched-chain amino acid transport system ATP-binding protein/branched-chain amino acid transport system permease protein